MVAAQAQRPPVFVRLYGLYTYVRSLRTPPSARKHEPDQRVNGRLVASRTLARRRRRSPRYLRSVTAPREDGRRVTGPEQPSTSTLSYDVPGSRRQRLPTASADTMRADRLADGVVSRNHVARRTPLREALLSRR